MVAVGVACGAAALARSELILLVPLLVAPLGLLVRSAAFRRRARLVAVGAAAALVVIAPWVGYNIVRFRHPVYLSSQFDSLLASANCDSVYYGPGTGYFSIPCAAAVAKRHHLTNEMDESEQAIVFRRAAVEYIRDHQSRLPIVAAARVGRILGVFHPSHQLAADVVVDGREVPVSRAALFSFYSLTLLSFAGVIVLRRRGAAPVFPLIAVLVMVVLTVALTYGDTRFRAPAEVVLAILAAVAVDAGISAVSARRRDRHDQAGPGAIGDTESGFVRVSEPR
jgi:4-amino-4-deoxy-L-arabinose transferase-like glycosyltransferase